MEGRIEELLGGFGIEAPNEFRGVFEIGKEDRDLLALPGQGRAGRQDLVGEMGGRVGEGRPYRYFYRLGGHGGSRTRLTRPDEDATVLIHRHTLSLNEFRFHIVQIRVIELELPLESAIG